MRVASVLASVAVLQLFSALAFAATDASAPDVAALLKRLDEQEQRIKSLEERLALQQRKPAATGGASVSTETSNPASPASVNPTPGTAAIAVAPAKAGPQGFAIQSPDGANVLRFRANLAFDGHWFSDQSTPATADTWLFRKVRPYIEGTLDNTYDFRLMPDFAGGKAIIVDAYVAARIAPQFVVQVGKFKGPVGLERLQPDQYNRFVELGLPSSLVPNRDEGAQLGGDLFGGIVGYAVGYFNGVTDGASTDAAGTPDQDNDGKKDWEGRLFLQPFITTDRAYLRGLGFGAGGTYVDITGSAANALLPAYRTPGQQIFFSYRSGATATYADGRRERWAPQLYYYVGPFGVLAEYVQSSQQVSRQVSASVRRSGQIDNSGWQTSFSYFLTGERELYNGLTPHSTFEPGKPGIGAWELVARYHELRIDPAAFAGGIESFSDPAVSARSARAFGVGLNWYLNQNIKWMLDFERTRFEGGAPADANRADENAFLTRFQLIF